MIDELKKLRELTETLTGNGYLRDHTVEWEYALDAIPDCVYIINGKFEIKFVNNALAKRLGVKKEECINQLCYELIRNSNEEQALKFWASVEVVKDEPILENYYIENLNGWFTIVRSPIITEAGKFIGFICVLQDVTEKRQAEILVNKHKEYSKRLIDSTPIGIHVYKVIDDKLILTHFNNASSKMLNMDAEEVLGKPMHEIFPGHKEKGGLVDIYKNIAINGTESFEVEMYNYQDDKINGVFYVFAFQSDKNEVAVFFNDVTEQAATKKLLVESEQKYRLMVENVLDVIWTTDVNLVETYINPAVEELTGYTPEECIGHNMSEFTTPEDYLFMITTAATYLESDTLDFIEFESHMLHKDGHKVPVKIKAKRIEKEGKTVGFQGITRAIR